MSMGRGRQKCWERTGRFGRGVGYSDKGSVKVERRIIRRTSERGGAEQNRVFVVGELEKGKEENQKGREERMMGKAGLIQSVVAKAGEERNKVDMNGSSEK